MMRLVLFACGSAFLTTAAFAQSLTLKPPTVQYVSVVGSTSVPSAAPGAPLTLWADVTPKANIHVYAPGAKDVIPVALVMTPRSGITFSKPSYPAGELSATVGVDAPVPVYNKTFRIAQPIVLARPLISGETVTLAGAVNYQACDDRVCYPPASMPVMWSVKVQ